MTRVDTCSWSDRSYEWVAINGPFNLLSCLRDRHLLQSGKLVLEIKLERDFDENLIPRRMRKELYQEFRDSLRNGRFSRTCSVVEPHNRSICAPTSDPASESSQ